MPNSSLWHKIEFSRFLSFSLCIHTHLSHQLQWWSIQHTQTIKRATSWGTAVPAMHGERPHYYLCTLIKGEGKLFINHTCPRGRQRRREMREQKEWGMWVTGELQASNFSGRQHKYYTGSFIIHAVQTHQQWLHWSCSASVDMTHWHMQRTLPWVTESHNLLLINVHKHVQTHIPTYTSFLPQKSEPEPNNQLSFPCGRHRASCSLQPPPPSILPPSSLPGSDREIEGVINSELQGLCPLTCGSLSSTGFPSLLLLFSPSALPWH